jgi:choline dehydrogenase-like flavoprotein
MPPVVKEFDVVVIGAGSSGCALAGRLVELSGLSVGLVEAGPDYGPIGGGRWPTELLDPRRFPKTHDWGLVQARARVVGGCSAHNQCAVVRALPGDFDRWAAAGNRGWGDNDLAPVLRDVERRLPIRQYRDGELAFWQGSFLEAAITAGFPRVGDLSDPEPAEGVAPFHANLRGSIRWNAAFTFLDPVRERPTLRVVADTIADRLVVSAGRAGSLIGYSPNGMIELRAQRFVLCAGVYGSPAILMRSGIGPPDALQKLGIPVHVPLPGVGENLHDHPGIAIDYEPNTQVRQAFEKELTDGKVYQSQVILKALADGPSGGSPIHVLPYQAPEESGAWRFVLMAFAMRPRSRGSVRLSGRAPCDTPQIDFKFASDPDGRDLATLTAGLRLIRRLAKLPPLNGAIQREIVPGDSLATDRERAKFIRARAAGYSHPVGTCRMGLSPDAGAVIGPGGAVHGVENVFVADASIIPEIPRANTNLTCMLIGWKLAELLLGAR